MDKLSNGINPISGSRVHEDDIVRDSRIISCFEYIAQVLERDIENEEKPSAPTNRKRGRKAFYITPEQFAQLRVNYGKCKVSDIANEINRVSSGNDSRKMQAVWINDWLESLGLLMKNHAGSRVPTADGNDIGITSELHKSAWGEEYYTNCYSVQAQTFIYDNLEAILALRYNGIPIISDKYTNTDYPVGMRIGDFIRLHADKCFIMSAYSCDTMTGKGSFTAVLLYKGRKKFLHQSDICTRSANFCALCGLESAAQAIKSPSDIIILTSTSLGFNSPKSKNYEKCCNIINTLVNAGCNVSVSVCKGQGYELGNFIRQLEYRE